MTGTLVFTGPVGPGNSVTALNLSNLKRIEFDFKAQVLRTVNQNEQIQTFDLHATTTFTAAVTVGTLVTETLSQ